MAYMTDSAGVLGALQTELATKNSTSTKAGKDLSTDDFLVLMCAMFQNQDIDNTASTTDMMNQFVQISVIQAISEISSLVKDTNTLSYAASLVGKDVTIGIYEGNHLKEIEGRITGTGTLNGEQVVFIGDDIYKLSDIMAVGKLPDIRPTDKPNEGDKVENVAKPGEDKQPENTDKVENNDNSDNVDNSENVENTENPEAPENNPVDNPNQSQGADNAEGPENAENAEGDGVNKTEGTETDASEQQTPDNANLGNPNQNGEDEGTRPLLA